MKSQGYVNILMSAIGLLLFFFLILSFGNDNGHYVWVFSAFLTLLSLGGLSVSKHFIIRELISTQHSLKFFSRAILLILACAVLILCFNILALGYLPGLDIHGTPALIKNFYTTLILVVLIYSFGGFIDIRKAHLLALEENHLLKQEALQANIEAKAQQLSFLKSQLHPHFLFNTLNTIYGQSLTKSDKTPKTILKLSSLLDYMLYNSQKDQVPLEMEVKHIQELIELEQIRFGDSVEVHFLKPERDKIKDISVAPMLFLPFVENAFKHGAFIDGKLRCRFSLKITDQNIHFEAENSCKKSEPKATGIGLDNIRNRLDLIYGSAYSLNLSQDEDEYLVNLKIPVKI